VGRATTPQNRRPSASSARGREHGSAGAVRGRGAREAPGADEDDRGRFVDLARAVDARGAGMATACAEGECAPNGESVEREKRSRETRALFRRSR